MVFCQLDVWVIDPRPSLFDWAKFRRTRGAVKLHLPLDHDCYLPSFVVITEERQHEARVAHTLTFPPSTIPVIDQGYTDLRWLVDLTPADVGIARSRFPTPNRQGARPVFSKRETP